MEQFNQSNEILKRDWKLTKDEISEVKEISKNDEKIKILETTKTDFDNFIDSDYRLANENYLRQNWKTVSDLQKKLKIEATWIYSKETFFTLIKYQKENWLMVDWIAWPETNTSLFWIDNITKEKIISHYKNNWENKNIWNNEDASNIFMNKWVWLWSILKLINLWFRNIDYSIKPYETSLTINDYSLSDNEDNSFTKMFYSEPLEKKWSMTLCSRTARKNLYNLWINKNDVAWGDSAISSMNMYSDNSNYVNNFSLIPEWANVLDLFVDTNSRYEHRCVAYKKWSDWFVLDPYANKVVNSKNNRLPIPMDDYLSKYKLLWVFPKKSKIV